MITYIIQMELLKRIFLVLSILIAKFLTKCMYPVKNISYKEIYIDKYKHI